LFKVVRDTKRLRYIIFTFARHGFTSWLEQTKLYTYFTATRKLFTKKPSAQRSPAERFRTALEELGPTVVKLGQILSTRSDVLPEDWTAELSKLQDRVPPSEFKEIETFLAGELGRPSGEVFRSFDTVPFAAASVAQVYNARLMDGTDVVVKIQRPGAKDLIDKDLEIMEYLADLAGRHITAAADLNVQGIVREFARSLRREMDFTLEAKNIQRIGKNFHESAGVLIPRVFDEHTTPKCIVIKKVRGKKITETDGPPGERRKIAGEVARAVLKQIFTDGLFHADPHPGNIFVLDGGRIAFIDFGMVGRIELKAREDLAGLLSAAASKDSRRFSRMLLKIGRPAVEVDRHEFEKDAGEILERYHGLALKDIPFGRLFSDVLSVIRKYRVHFPAEYTMMLKTLVTTESVASALDADFDLVQTAKPFVKELLFSPRDMTGDLSALPAELMELGKILREFPSQVRTIMSKLNEGKLTFEFRHARLEKVIDGLDRAASRISFSLVIVALVMASSVMATFSKSDLLYYTGILGYFVAGIFTLVILIGTIRGGRL
jgi:ubiquinone biosynthesis protein